MPRESAGEPPGKWMMQEGHHDFLNPFPKKCGSPFRVCFESWDPGSARYPTGKHQRFIARTSRRKTGKSRQSFFRSLKPKIAHSRRSALHLESKILSGTGACHRNFMISSCPCIDSGWMFPVELKCTSDLPPREPSASCLFTLMGSIRYLTVRVWTMAKQV